MKKMMLLWALAALAGCEVNEAAKPNTNIVLENDAGSAIDDMKIISSDLKDTLESGAIGIGASKGFLLDPGTFFLYGRGYFTTYSDTLTLSGTEKLHWKSSRTVTCYQRPGMLTPNCTDTRVK